MKTLVFLVLFLCCQILFAQDMSPCQTTKELSNIYELIKTMKNDVLGVVPSFCREKAQAGDTSADEALKKFVQEKIKESSLKNPFPPKGKDLKNAISQIFAFVASKKAWHLSDTQSRYELLISKECGEAGFNRFPFTDKERAYPKDTEEKRKERLKKIYPLCSAKEFKDVAPYLTKDVVAESLFYLAQIFPKDFPNLITQTCELFKTTDATLLATNNYSEFIVADQDLDSLEKFSKWIATLQKQPYTNWNGNLRGAIIGIYQRQGNPSASLSNEESEALLDYTGQGFSYLNSCLRYENCDPETLKKVDYLKSAIVKLKGTNPKTQTYFRGTGNLPPEIVKAMEGSLQSQKPFELDKGFMSTSGSLKIAQRFAGGEDGIVFIIKSKNCAGINDSSYFQNEDEFLCPPGMKFKTTKKIDSESKITYYVLEEVPSK